MTPAARVAAAAEILDEIGAGAPAERALTGWARRSRFAGSKDRRAVRDLVFDALRKWRSLAWIGGAETGRGRMIGALRAAGKDVDAVFTGAGHAPLPLGDDERAAGRDLGDAPEAVRADLPDEVWTLFKRDHGAEAMEMADALRGRAGVHLRVNLSRGRVAEAVEALSREEIEARPHALAGTALEVVAGASKVSQSEAFRSGLVELQDAASQAVVEALSPLSALRVLDFCAGGGGKSLAMAALGAEVVAHDIDAGRMRDLPERAKRAGLSDRIDVSATAEGAFPLVLADAPCSGSGAWRRQPDAKWRFTTARLAELNRMQDDVLDAAASHVARGGRLAYATCSLIEAENGARVVAFLEARPGWRMTEERRWTPLDGGDGFYLAVLCAPG